MEMKIKITRQTNLTTFGFGQKLEVKKSTSEPGMKNVNNNIS